MSLRVNLVLEAQVLATGLDVLGFVAVDGGRQFLICRHMLY